MQPLATLAQVKSWVPNLSSGNDDVLLGQLLTRVSGAIMSGLSRSDVGVRTFNETANGKGTSSIFLREWPVLSIISLSIDGRVIPAAANFNAPGYTLIPWDGLLPGRPQQLSLKGHSFCRGAQNVSISYKGGYLVASEMQTVTTNKAVASQSDGAWASDQGVIYANGTALVAVSGAPAVGQYQLDVGVQGGYIFNAADNNVAMLISYGFIPAPLNQACVEIVAERYRYRGRIGQSSASVDGKEVASYDLSAVSKYVAMNLQPYKRVF